MGQFLIYSNHKLFETFSELLPACGAYSHPRLYKLCQVQL